MIGLEAAWISLGRQLRKPEGLGGHFLALTMSLANERSNSVAIAALDIARNDTILELGFGGGDAIRVIANAAAEAQVFGIDHSAAMCLRASRRLRSTIHDGRVLLVQGNLKRLPWQECAVDKCLAVHVAYFMSAREVHEARRVLRIGGRLVVLVTDKAAMRRWKFAFPETHRQFAESDLTRLLLDGGFSRQEMCLQRVSLGMGIPGLLALATKLTR